MLVGNVCDKEQDAVDNYPENLQGTDMYEAMERAVDNLESAMEMLDDAKDLLAEIVG